MISRFEAVGVGEALLYPAMPTLIYAVAAVQWVRCVMVESGL